MPITRAARANRANRTLLLNKIKFAFGSVVSEFLFPICVQKASSMKIAHFTVVYSVTWPLNGSEAGGDLALIQTSLVLSCKIT